MFTAVRALAFAPVSPAFTALLAELPALETLPRALATAPATLVCAPATAERIAPDCVDDAAVTAADCFWIAPEIAADAFCVAALMRWRSDFKSDGAGRFGEVEGGLNQMTIARFERILRQSRFRLESLEAVPIRRARWLHNRLTRELFTSVVRCRLAPRP